MSSYFIISSAWAIPINQLFILQMDNILKMFLSMKLSKHLSVLYPILLIWWLNKILYILNWKCMNKKTVVLDHPIVVLSCLSQVLHGYYHKSVAYFASLSILSLSSIICITHTCMKY